MGLSLFRPFRADGAKSIPYPGRRSAAVAAALCPGLVCCGLSGRTDGHADFAPKGQSHISPGQSAAPPWVGDARSRHSPRRGSHRSAQGKAPPWVGGHKVKEFAPKGQPQISPGQSAAPPWVGERKVRIRPEGAVTYQPRAERSAALGWGTQGHGFRPEGAATYQPRAERSAALGWGCITNGSPERATHGGVAEDMR